MDGSRGFDAKDFSQDEEGQAADRLFGIGIGRGNRL